MTTGIRQPVVFVDRDGVINRMRQDYVKSWLEFEPLPGAIDALARISSSGHDVIVVTNQSAIGRGLISLATVQEIHDRLSAMVEAVGGEIRRFLICPHAPADKCACRKPAPGLLCRARDELGVDLADAVLIGDQPTDVEAAHAAGCGAILIDPTGEFVGHYDVVDCRVAMSLCEAADLVLAG
jgi:histidinol-phosphate phosphatase family protein